MMMEKLARAAWLLLALIHVMPATVLFAPDLSMRLYGVDPIGPAGILIIHRGALFLAITAASFWAIIDPSARRVCSMVVGISIIGFLGVYARASLPDGPARTIAMVDAVALLPLIFVSYRAWVRPGLTAP
ncbi:MAG: hypothetical protein JHC88_10925 [Niveispirillum sp.]|nr:hypothetical protein [Niveispirillum sp.]